MDRRVSQPKDFSFSFGKSLAGNQENSAADKSPVSRHTTPKQVTKQGTHGYDFSHSQAEPMVNKSEARGTPVVQ